jgi:uroporphyrinogen-III synthase
LLILVTRPGDAGQGLATRLGALGHHALWWPAFDILPPEDPQPLYTAVARAGLFDLVVFVSPAAVHAWAQAPAAADPWPPGTRMAAVGGASRRAAAQLAGAAAATLLGPPGDAAGEGGTEALWPLLAALEPPPRRVLIVRAQTGRDWLALRLTQEGAQVEELVAYRRLVHEPADTDWAALQRALQGADGLAVLFSSTAAVAPLTQQLRARGVPMDGDAPRLALCVHARIADAARASGWRQVAYCEADADAIAGVLAAGAPAPLPAGVTQSAARR